MRRPIGKPPRQECVPNVMQFEALLGFNFRKMSQFDGTFAASHLQTVRARIKCSYVEHFPPTCASQIGRAIVKLNISQRLVELLFWGIILGCPQSNGFPPECLRRGLALGNAQSNNFRQNVTRRMLAPKNGAGKLANAKLIFSQRTCDS